MKLADHEFIDEEVSLRGGDEDVIELDCDIGSSDDMKYIEIHREDAIAIAIHFGLITKP